MKLTLANFVFLILIFQSCAKATSQPNSNGVANVNNQLNPELNYESSKWDKAFIDHLNSDIQDKLNQIINICDAEKKNNEEGCASETISPGKENPLEESKGQRVLLLDDASMALAAYTRYRDRVLENVIETDDGDYISDNGSIELPHVAKQILLDTFYHTEYSKVPAELLNSSEKSFSQKLNPALSQILFKPHSQGHGINIFNYIANNSPHSQFVMVYASDVKIEQIFCNNDKDDIKLGDIDHLFAKQADELNTYLQKYDIHFMLLSRGISKDYFVGDRTFCSHKSFSEKFKKRVNELYYDNYLNRISKNVILFQSNAHADYEIKNTSDPNYYSDCKEMANRVRVGVVNDLSTSIPFFGSQDTNKIYVTGENLNTAKCTDIYINIAVKKQRPYHYAKGVVSFSDFGIGAEPPVGPQIVSSYTSPIALTYALYLKTENPYATNDDLINKIRTFQGNRFIVLDPALNKQLPIYKLGYLN